MLAMMLIGYYFHIALRVNAQMIAAFGVTIIYFYTGILCRTADLYLIFVDICKSYAAFSITK